jgi:hypothetical protein
MLPLMEMVCYRLWKWYVTAYGNGMLPLMEMVCYRLWKWYVTAYGNGMLPLYATQVSYPRQYATTLGNRLWKWYVTDCLVTYPVMQPLIEMVGNRFMQPK